MRKNPSQPSHIHPSRTPRHTTNARRNRRALTYYAEVSNGNCASSHSRNHRSTEPTISLEPQYDRGGRDPRSPDSHHGMLDAVSPEREFLDDYGMRDPVSPDPVSSNVEILDDYGMRDPVSPLPVSPPPIFPPAVSPPLVSPPPVSVSHSPVSLDQEVLDDYGMRDPVSPDPVSFDPVSLDPVSPVSLDQGVLDDYGMRDPVSPGQVSTDSEVLDDFGMRDPVSPDPEHSDDLGTSATAFPDPGLFEEGPSQIGARQPTQAKGHFGSSARVRYPPPSSRKRIEKGPPGIVQGRNRRHESNSRVLRMEADVLQAVYDAFSHLCDQVQGISDLMNEAIHDLEDTEVQALL